MERAPRTRRRARALVVAPLTVAALFLAPLLGSAAAKPVKPVKTPPGAAQAAAPARSATVMTRNLYLGAGLDGIVTALAGGDQNAVVAAATATWQQAVASDPEERMAEIADEIVAARPHAVGLQEVTEFTTYDFDPLTGQVSDPTEAYDFLDLLMAELDERGAGYRVVPGATAENFTSQPIPIIAGAPFPTKAVKLLDRDVIIVRDGVRATNARNGSFETVITQPLRIDRGWGSADLRTGLARFRFVNAHTEAFGPEEIRVAEVTELFAAQAEITRQSGALPTVYAGDYNSDAPSMGKGEGGEAGYQTLLGGGLRDLWVLARPSATDAESNTCCQDADLGNAVSDLSSRIDLLLATPDVRVTRADRVGDEPVELPGDTHWASDHAGVVATVVVPRR